MRLCLEKNEEIKRLYDNLKLFREASESEKKQLSSLIDILREKLKDIERANLEEIEHLKIKMAQLHSADIHNIEQYY